MRPLGLITTEPLLNQRQHPMTGSIPEAASLPDTRRLEAPGSPDETGVGFSFAPALPPAVCVAGPLRPHNTIARITATAAADTMAGTSHVFFCGSGTGPGSVSGTIAGFGGGPGGTTGGRGDGRGGRILRIVSARLSRWRSRGGVSASSQ